MGGLSRFINSIIGRDSDQPRSEVEEADTAFRHIDERHATVEQGGCPRFTCGACGMPGLGLCHICTRCHGDHDRLLLHRFCQRAPAGGQCVIHPNMGWAHRMSCVWMALWTQPGCCAACGQQISPGRWMYECKRGRQYTRVHLTCYLIQDTNNQSTLFPRFCRHGHCLLNDYDDDVGDYNCATCGTRGVGLRLRCRVCGGGSHHPMCIDARYANERVCLKHISGGGLEHSMRWTKPPARRENLECVLCLKKVKGWHYRCEVEVRTAIHPICAQLLQEDRQFEVVSEFFENTINGFLCLVAQLVSFCQPND